MNVQKEKHHFNFFTKIFGSLLISGLIQLVLMALFMIVFSNSIIVGLYKGRSDARLELIKNQLNLIINE
ncbi:MAG TPA: hypothetical protein VFC68_03705, partial [Treponemataceae bacterium]|nr:hypothetical protein [Treponemataceae bacterium]